jgi:hypothetical protein
VAIVVAHLVTAIALHLVITVAYYLSLVFGSMSQALHLELLYMGLWQTFWTPWNNGKQDTIMSYTSYENPNIQ